ncbi:MAG: aminopeptidase N, partial [Candidatus Accumulibacter sp.]|nr:aminopeptidase N [Accumulibacter sp.]
MPNETHRPIRLEDYAPPPYLIETVGLDVDIRADATLVSATLVCARNRAAPGAQALILDGEELETLSVSLDGKPLAAGAYRLDASRLTIDAVPERFTLRTQVRIRPDRNTRLSGFYRSRDGYFTQCEPEGFRRIIWFIDRPDVMARYTVTLHADKKAFPVLLSNGNPVAQGDEPDGRHYATWEDPFRKPSYLFAMVAGQLDVLRDTFRTASGREVRLAIYVEPGKLDQCPHAMAALKKAMRWDERRFGLECDLDHYMIAAIGDFNMGAMENKGLNVFNTKYVLARADVATDADFENIDR